MENKKSKKQKYPSDKMDTNKSTDKNTPTNFNINKKYKDRLFCFIFGNEKYKADLLSLYNALNHSSYTNPDDLEITTIDDVIYMKMKNDLSFIIKTYMPLYEEQSTYNPNMPIRGLIYFAKLYSKWIETHHCNIYGSSLIKLPTPQYYVFYIGEDQDVKNKEYLRLSDAFDTEGKVKGFEWTATMLNINKGHNKALLGKCKTLRDYSYFIDYVRRRNKEHGDFNKAVDEAVQVFKKGTGTFAEVLRNNEAEVKDMCITEYDEEATLIAFREEGRKLEAAAQLVSHVHRAMHKLHMSLEQACDYEDVTMEDYYNAVKFVQNV